MRTLHLLEVKYNKIKEMIPKIKENNFDAVQIGNSAKLKSHLYPNELNKKYGHPYKRNIYADWYKLYQNLMFEIGNDLGTKEELEELCEVANEYNVIIVTDFVPRHLANGDRGNQMNPNPNCDKDLLAHPECFLDKIKMNDHDRHSVIWNCNDLPSLNYTNDLVLSKYRKYLQELMDCGIRGIRIDMAKHFALPSEGGSKFWNLINEFKDKYNLVVYGECIQCSDDLLNRYIQETGIMVLTDYVGFWDREKTMAMIYSHDHALTWNTDVPNNKVIDGYCRLCATHNHTLFYTMDYLNWDDPRVREANKNRINY